MHETGLCEAIVEAALRRAEGRRVGGVRVRVAGHPVDPRVIEQGVRLAAAGTVAEDAVVELVVEPPSVRCRDCGGRSEVANATVLAACPVCGGVDVEPPGDEDVVLESITIAPSGGGKA